MFLRLIYPPAGKIHLCLRFRIPALRKQLQNAFRAPLGPRFNKVMPGDNRRAGEAQTGRLLLTGLLLPKLYNITLSHKTASFLMLSLLSVLSVLLLFPSLSSIRAGACSQILKQI
jgi:hypothetical protein